MKIDSINAITPQIEYDENVLEILNSIVTEETKIIDDSEIYSKGNVSNDCEISFSDINVTQEDIDNFRKRIFS
ncbi:hypothetical protein G4T00_000754 [Campylobacter jejuni]|uniref:hypothetical protein n=1 Tax=Campylobacter jejuni TaxID=197 RepID=UPI0012D18C99|nr:hypothetical protein [Campylobacter jejuni]EAH7554460.1 hypothetical protein [Campylobacter jejuni]EAI3875629.1 hypothetical protein [Campylobacter jejuni]EAK1068570.1 hypothetical protein [Campylobacter jejuni]ECP6735563.1 hypothetical protein [Campylobacter jejuni]EDJ1992122.1 hypothetical protein [Campylobacter jejuni]